MSGLLVAEHRQVWGLRCDEGWTVSERSVGQEQRQQLQALRAEKKFIADNALMYLEQIMGTLGIASYDGLLNTWRYGSDPSQAGHTGDGAGSRGLVVFL